MITFDEAAGAARGDDMGARSRVGRATWFISSGWLAFMATLVVHGAYTHGRPIVGTDTKLYIDLADDLLRGDLRHVFSPEGLLWSKLIYIALLALTRRLSPAHWAGIMMAMNVVCSAAAAAILSRFVHRATRSIAATLAVPLYYLTIIDIAYWVPWVLTDMLYLLTALLPFVVIGRALIGEPLRHHRLMLALACLVCATSRPPGVIVALIALFAEIVFVSSGATHPRMRKGLFAAFFVCVVIAVCARTHIIAQPARWHVRWLRPRIEFIAGIEKKGEVFFGRPDMRHAPPRTLVDYASLEAERFVRIFQFSSVLFSVRHLVVNWLVFGSMYLFGIYAVVDALRRREQRRSALVWTTLFWIFVSALFLTVTLMDGEWRYRVPLLPQFIALAALGIAAARRSMSKPARA